MIKKERGSSAARMGAYVLVFLYLLAMVGFLFVDYIVALYLAIMAVLLALIGGLSPYLRSILVRRRRWRRDDGKRRFLPIGCGVVFLAVLTLIVNLLLTGDGVGCPTFCTYEVLLEPTDSSLKSFSLKEGLKVGGRSPQSWQFPERQVIGTSRGVLLKEVNFEPAQAVREACFSYGSGCLKAEVELVDFPLGAVYQIKGEEDRKIYPYLDTETITCSVYNPRRDVAFAYVPPPYNRLRPVLEPFAAMSSSQLSTVLAGLLGVAVLAFAARAAFPRFHKLPVIRDVRRLGAQRHKIALEKRLEDLMADYEAANRQLGMTLSEVDRGRLKRQIEGVEDEISEVQGRLAALQE